MAKPILDRVPAFDPKLDYLFTFTWSGNQAYQNTLKITDTSTNAVVYEKTIVSRKLEHLLPAKTLSVGRTYAAQVKITDGHNETSYYSDKAVFNTYDTPIFMLNVVDKQRVSTSSVELIITYVQTQGELLKEFKFYLYDATGAIIEESDYWYDSNTKFTFKALENNTAYYVRATGETVHGMKLDTGKVLLNVEYLTPDTYSVFYIECIHKKGFMRYNTNFVIIDYNGDETFEYIDGGKINLIGKVLYYDSGFTIEKDFTTMIVGEHLWNNKTIFTMKNKTQTLTLRSIIFKDRLRFELDVNNGLSSYILYSNALSFTNDDNLLITLRRVKNLYQFYIYINDKQKAALKNEKYVWTYIDKDM